MAPDAAVRLRVLSAEDWQAWRLVRLRALGEDPGAFCSTLAEWTGPGDLEERWRGRLSIPGAHDLLAEVDGVPVGMASGVPADVSTGVSTDGPAVVEVISMWVAPEARGRGVGGTLMAELVRWARDTGARELRLDVAEDNDAAVVLYQRQGLAFTGAVTGRMPGGVRRELRMSLRL